MLGKGGAPEFLSLPPPHPHPRSLTSWFRPDGKQASCPGLKLQVSGAEVSMVSVSSFLPFFSWSFYCFHQPNCLLFCNLKMYCFSFLQKWHLWNMESLNKQTESENNNSTTVESLSSFLECLFRPLTWPAAPRTFSQAAKDAFQPVPVSATSWYHVKLSKIHRINCNDFELQMTNKTTAWLTAFKAAP